MRSTRLLSLVALALGAVLFVTSGADAQRRHRRRRGEQGQASAQDRERARTAYGRGQQQFQAGDFAAAEASFREAYQAVANPVVLLSVAECQERGGNNTGAAETLQQYLRDRADAPDRSAIEERIRTLRERPTAVSISSTPAGASITIDGHATEHTTPADIQLSPGEHTVALNLAGYETATQTVTVQTGPRQEVTMPLTQSRAAESEEDALGAQGPGPEETTSEETQSSGGDGDEGGGPSAAVWIAAAIGGASLVAGTVLGFLALSEQSDFDAMPTEATADRGERLALFADVAFGVAAVAVITSIVLYATDDAPAGEEEEAGSGASSARLIPVLSPSGGGLGASVRF